MPNQTIRITLLFLSLAAAGALGLVVGRKHEEQSLTTPVIRTYHVPPQRAEELRNMLSKLFWQKDSDSGASAQVFGDGLMLVRAPLGYQNGIGNLVYNVSQEKDNTIRQSVHLDYWLVLGETAAHSNADALGTLAPALASVDQVDGPRKFRVLEHLGTSAMNGTESDVKGSIVELKSKASVVGGEVTLTFQVHSHAGEVAAETAAKPGELIVLGQNAFRAEGDMAKFVKGGSTENPPNVYHIIRAELVN